VSSLPSTKTVLLNTDHTRQSALWNGRHPLSFYQTCGSKQSRLNPIDYRTLAEMQQWLYKLTVHDVDEPKQHMQCLACLRAKLDQWCNKWARHKGRTFKHLIWLQHTCFLFPDFVNIKSKPVLLCYLCQSLLFFVFLYFTM